MAKENKSKLIIWALVALVIGVIIGLLITNIIITGNSSKTLKSEIIEINTPHGIFTTKVTDVPCCKSGDYNLICCILSSPPPSPEIIN